MADGVIYLVDDDAAMRDSLAFLFSTEGRQVEAFDSPTKFLSIAPSLRGGCIVTDVRMPEMNGVQLVRRLKDLGVGLPVVMITGHADVPIAVEAMKAGVTDFIEKPFADHTILAAVDAAFAWAASADKQAQHQADARKRLSSLTEREMQVMRGVVAGRSNKVIAQALSISPRTVDIYRANVMTKTRAGSLSELVRLAISAGED
jgi:two-component system response regulator FixJ